MAKIDQFAQKTNLGELTLVMYILGQYLRYSHMDANSVNYTKEFQTILNYPKETKQYLFNPHLKILIHVHV